MVIAGPKLTRFGTKLVTQINIPVTKVVLDPVVLQGKPQKGLLLIGGRSVWLFLWAERVLYVQVYWSA